MSSGAHKRAPKNGRHFPNIEGFYTEFRGRHACARRGILRLAACGNQERLAFEDQVRVADGWIHLNDAGPAGGMAKLGMSDGRQRVTLFHRDLRCSPR